MAVDQWDTLLTYARDFIAIVVHHSRRSARGEALDRRVGKEKKKKGPGDPCGRTRRRRLTSSPRIKEPWNAASKKHAETR